MLFRCVRRSIRQSVRPSVRNPYFFFFEFAKSLISDLNDGCKMERRHTHAHTHTYTHTHTHTDTYKRVAKVNKSAEPRGGIANTHTHTRTNARPQLTSWWRDSETHTHAQTHSCTLTRTHAHALRRSALNNEMIEPNASTALYPALLG